MHGSDLILGVAQLGKHFVSVLAQQGRRGDFGLGVGELDGATHGEVAATLFVRHFHNGAAGTQRLVVEQFLHRQYRSAWDVKLAEDVNSLKLGLVLNEVLKK